MCEDDCLENNRFLKEAYSQNQRKKAADFKPKVCGPSFLVVYILTQLLPSKTNDKVTVKMILKFI